MVIKTEPKPDAKPAAAKKPRKPKTKRVTRRKTTRKQAAAKPASAPPEKDGRDRTGESVLDGREDAVREALRKAGGLKSVAAQALKVSRGTLYRFLDKNTEIAESLDDIDEEIKDLAEGQMLKLLRAGDPQTVRWFLEMKGKDRGYVRRSEHTGKNGGPIETAEKTDLSKYTDDELTQMLAIEEARAKRESEAGGK